MCVCVCVWETEWSAVHPLVVEAVVVVVGGGVGGVEEWSSRRGRLQSRQRADKRSRCASPRPSPSVGTPLSPTSPSLIVFISPARPSVPLGGGGGGGGGGV